MEKGRNVHMLLVPFPAQGHIKPMLKLAQLLCLAGFHVTFLNTDHTHHLLLGSAEQSLFTSWPRLHFETISDGLPTDHPRSGLLIRDLFESINSVFKPLFRQLLYSLSRQPQGRPPVTGIIADGVMSFAIDAAQELGVPLMFFRTLSACCLWCYFCLPKLIEAGQLPFQADDDMDRPVTCIPDMETFLRRRDLPSICRFRDLNHPVLQFFMNETIALTRASTLILNTFDDLERPVLSRISSMFRRVYTIGPLHGLLTNRLGVGSGHSTGGESLWKEERGCLAWLESHPAKSVLYVSFGSLVSLNREQMLEFWYGLVNSGKPFLWVIRSNSISGGEEGGRKIPAELEEATKERGFMVGWAPQEEVLAHPSIGGFLTHAGWNSMLESIYAGVPMICWPGFADQQINSRFVSEVWGLGVDMKDTCDRLTVDKMVRELMEGRRDEFRRSTDEMAMMARKCVCESGSSSCNLDRLIADIRSTCSD